MRTAVLSDKIAKPVGPFSPAVRHGNALYLSGQVGQDPATGRLVEGGVRVGIFLVDMNDFGTVNEICAKFFPPLSLPVPRSPSPRFH